MSDMIAEISDRSRALMHELGERFLGRPLADLGWRFELDGARRRLGLCRWRSGPGAKKIISISRHFATQGGWAVMEDVVRHEIAHAMDYETRGRSAHDDVWKAWARRCGADPTRTFDGEIEDDPDSKYVGRCPAEGCDYARPFYREVSSAYYCPTCSASGARSYLRIVERRTGRVLAEGGDTPAPTSPRRPPRYLARCPECGAERPFRRRPTRRYACAECCSRYSGGRFDDRYEMELFVRSLA